MYISLENLKLKDIKVGFKFKNSRGTLIEVIKVEHKDHVILQSSNWSCTYKYTKKSILNRLLTNYYTLPAKIKILELNYEIY